MKSQGNTESLPWYRHFWVWFAICIPLSAVIAGVVTLMIAIKNPDHLVVDKDEYNRIRSDLRAQPATQPAAAVAETEAEVTESETDGDQRH